MENTKLYLLKLLNQIQDTYDRAVIAFDVSFGMILIGRRG